MTEKAEKEATPERAPTAWERMANREADRAADEYQKQCGW